MHKVKIKIQIKFPSGFGPESAPTHRFPQRNKSPDPPPDPPGGGGTRHKLKSVLKYRWGDLIVQAMFPADRRAPPDTMIQRNFVTLPGRGQPELPNRPERGCPATF